MKKCANCDIEIEEGPDDIFCSEHCAEDFAGYGSEVNITNNKEFRDKQNAKLKLTLEK